MTIQELACPIHHVGKVGYTIRLELLFGSLFRHIAVAMQPLVQIGQKNLTTSQKRQDIIESFKLGVAGYIVKPINYKEFVEAIKIIDNYWTLSILPGGSLASLAV